MVDTAILKAFNLGIKRILEITEYADHVRIVGLLGTEEVTYLFYHDGRILLK